uniref:Transmembrane protein n=2 Tax=Kalmanozyma brasiliensis (strain GHG001) TaxID=1365824 RepID=V5ECR0_KALBG
MLCLVVLALQLLTHTVSAHLTPVRSSHATTFSQRDAFSDQDPIDNEGEDHGKPVVPSGANLVSLPVTNAASLAVYWTANPQNSTATNAYIMMHGKLRDGANYWTVLNDVLRNAVAAKTPNAASTSIVTAPEFYSTKFNSGQYSADQLAWADTNVWQAAEAATHPAGSNVTSFDALDALLMEFSDTSKYPAMKQITFVGHGGGGQLISRYAMAGAGLPASSNIHLRYVVGDPSSNPYFTLDRPLQDASVASKTTCPLYNRWRYGFDRFNGTQMGGLLTPQQYFARLATRDVRWVVGYQDTEANGDNTCMAKLQGGAARRDRNLSWWRYINTLAGTKEDLTGFPGALPGMASWGNLTNNTLNHRLTVVYNATHNVEEVYSSMQGTSALFDDTQNVQLGWRPQGWKNVTSVNQSTKNGTSAAPATSAGATVGVQQGWTGLIAVAAMVVVGLSVA